MCVAAGVQVYLGGLCTNTMREHCHGEAFFYSASGDEGAGGGQRSGNSSTHKEKLPVNKPRERDRAAKEA